MNNKKVKVSYSYLPFYTDLFFLIKSSDPPALSDQLLLH